MGNVIVFGSMNMDLSIEAPRMPVAGETISGGGFLTTPGGKGANQAVACARLGAPTRMLAAVGDDAFGRELVAGLEAAGVACENVRVRDDETTGVAMILRCAGDNRIVLHAGANHALRAHEVAAALESLLSPGDVLVCQGECDASATEAAIRSAHGLGAFVLLNPAPARPVPDDLWSCVDLVCLNETEAEELCGVLPVDDASAREAASRLRSRGAGAVVVTLGAAGSVGIDAEGTFVRVPARAFGEVADTTAAGDTYVGALAAGQVRGLPLREAMAWGADAAGITVTRLGAQRSIPTAAEVDEARRSGCVSGGVEARDDEAGSACGGVRGDAACVGARDAGAASGRVGAERAGTARTGAVPASATHVDAAPASAVPASAKHAEVQGGDAR